MEYRQLTVDGRRFEWARSANGEILHVRSVRAGQPLEATISIGWPLGPQHVAQVVRTALRSGWKPTGAGAPDEPHRITLEL